jgi:hypothetical protein
MAIFVSSQHLRAHDWELFSPASNAQRVER